MRWGNRRREEKGRIEMGERRKVGRMMMRGGERERSAGGRRKRRRKVDRKRSIQN